MHSLSEVHRRISLVRKLYAEGKRQKQIAHALGYTTAGGLTHFLRRNADHLRAEIRFSHGGPGRQKVVREEALKRLRLASLVEAEGVQVQALAAWLRYNAPDGAAAALAELTANV